MLQIVEIDATVLIAVVRVGLMPLDTRRIIKVDIVTD
jgi:hypothetical protein